MTRMTIFSGEDGVVWPYPPHSGRLGDPPLPCRPYCVVSTENPGPFSLNRAGFVELLLLRVKTRISRH